MSVALLFTVKLSKTHAFIMKVSALSEKKFYNNFKDRNFLVSSPTAHIATRHNLLSR